MTKEEYQELKDFYHRKLSSTKGDYSNRAQGYSEGLNSFMSKAKELYEKSQNRELHQKNQNQENKMYAIDKAVDVVMEQNQINQEEIIEVETWEMLI